jgi:putative tryptophan/tyrosine transport system substrate-binding protein
MRRRDFVAALAAFAAGAARAEETPAAPRLHVGMAGVPPRTSPVVTAFEGRLHALGYLDGKNLVFEFIDLHGDPAGWPEAARELVRRKVDVVFAGGSEIALKSSLAASGTLPIVIAAVDYDPVALGYVSGLARPGGTVTGVVFQQGELTVKRLQLVKEVLPGIDAATMIWDGRSADQWRVASNAAGRVGLRLEGIEFRDPPFDYERALDRVPPDARRALIVPTSGTFLNDRERLSALARERRMASFFTDRLFAEAGGLVSYGTDTVGLFAHAADYVDRIARGVKPADLPIEQPTKFELVINLKTAKAVGITIPSTLLARAEGVIE